MTLQQLASSRRRLLSTALVLGTTALLGACGSGGRGRPLERAISFGFEDVASTTTDWPELNRRLHAVGANAVNINVGRLDWTAFPWQQQPGSWSSQVRTAGVDFVSEAVQNLRYGPDGARRTVVLTIDALMPRWIGAQPDLAGIAADGSRSDSFASLTALTRGRIADLLVELTAEIGQRYQPDRIALTELMFDGNTFGKDDFADYRESSGAADWPRQSDGTIDTQALEIADWRSEALAGLVGRIRAAAHGQSVDLDMDVRAPGGDPTGDRSLSGHNYDLLLDAADRIVVWNYFGLDAREPADTAGLVEEFQRRAPGRSVMSIGLWTERGTISAADLSTALDASAGIPAISITPASLLTHAHWESIERAWASNG